jgi:outer membrane protein
MELNRQGKKMTNTRRFLTTALAGLLAAPALAQPVGFLEVYNRALVNDPAFREAEALYLATAEVKPQARSALLPNLSLGASRSKIYSDTPGGALDPTGITIGSRSEFDQDSHGWSVSLTQTVFDWSRYATLRQADKRVVRAETDYEAAKQDLLIRVANRYFAVLAAEDDLAAAEAAREAIGRQLEQAQRRFEVGLIAITDVQQSQAAYDTALAEVIAAERVLATAHEFLREIIGEDIADLAGPVSDLPLLSPDPANIDQWVRTALDQNLTLISQRLAVDIADNQIDIDRGNRLPKLSLSAGYNDDTRDRSQTIYGPTGQVVPGFPQVSTQFPEGYNWSLSLNFPIYTGGLNRSRVQQSVYNYRASSEALERISRQTERATRDSYLSVNSEISRVQALRQSVESNTTSLRATEAGFEVGTQTTVDVLAAQQRLTSAQTDYSRSRYNYILNTLGLKQASGSLGAQDVEQIDGWLEK